MSFRIQASHKFLVDGEPEKPEEKTVYLYSTPSGKGKTSIIDSAKVSIKQPTKPKNTAKKGLVISTDESSQADYM